MKGVIFTEFLDMVDTSFPPGTVDDVIEAAQVPSGGAYTAVGTYDVGEMVSLVTALSAKTGTPVPDLLRTYGRFLFGRLAEHYPKMVEPTPSLVALLASLDDVIHPEVLKLYPDAELPRFAARTLPDGSLELEYRSPRHLDDVAHGLLEGASDYFGEPVTISRSQLGDGATLFRVVPS